LRQRHHSNRHLRSFLTLAGHEVCDKEPVYQETAHQGSRNEAPLGEGCCVTPRRAPRNLFNRRWQILQCAPERRHVEHAPEVGLLFEPRSLASSELRVDEYELWADGLGLHAGVEGSSFPRRPPKGLQRQYHAPSRRRPLLPIPILRMQNTGHNGKEPGGIPSKGDRIQLLRTRMGIRVSGTVYYSDQLQILVKWDNGLSQSLRVGVDRYRILE
jgi:hypothetical protein